MTDDLLTALKAADPASGIDLSRIDEPALAGLREGILMTPRPTTTPRSRHRWLRRHAIGVTSAVVLIGGTAGAAAYQQWYEGGALEELTCMTTWQDPLTAEDALDATGGPPLSTDAVADCRKYQSQAGLPDIEDPVAFTRNGYVFVVPRDQVPADGADLAARPPDAAAVLELRASMGDWVDGGESRCFTRTSGPAFAKREIDRLGLSGWTVRTMPSEQAPDKDACGFLDADVTSSQVRFYQHRGDGPQLDGKGITGGLRNALRDGIAGGCLSAPDAEALAEAAVGANHHWPTTAVIDPDADCARVDLVIGGSIQITVYGPETARG